MNPGTKNSDRDIKMTNFLLVIFILITNSCLSQTIIYNDNFETTGFNWKGVPKQNLYTTFFSNNSQLVDNPSNQPFFTSPNRGFGILGTGTGSSSIERDTINFPNIVGLNPANQYKIKIRLASFGINTTMNPASGVDGSDYLQLSYSSNGGITFIPEFRLLGASNACWGFNRPGVINKNANGSLLIQSITIGSEPSTIELNLPNGTTQVSLNLILSLNASGESWIIDDVQLLETQVILPLILGDAKIKFYGNYYELNWVTLSERNVDYFSVILRSEIGEEKEIGQVKADGFSDLQNYYKFVSEKPVGKNYLILREIDFDGYCENLKIFYIFREEELLKTNLLHKYNILGQLIK